MNTLIKTAVVLGLFLMAASRGRAENAAADLAKCQSFAFGGIGVAGLITPGEKHFKSMLRNGDSLEKFRRVLANGTPAAKLYALCGIRELDRGSFEQAAAPLQKENPEVETAGGCMVWRQHAKELIKNIANGAYDAHFHDGR